jgi:cytochrome c2
MPKVLPVLILVVAATLLTTACGPRTTAPAHPAQVGGRPAPGNPEAGKQVFLVCTACHSLAPGQNMVGPSLHGLIGRRAGTAPGFQYSAANKASGLIWKIPRRPSPAPT